MQRPVELPADLVVLEIGLTPSPETNEIANLIGLPRSGDGFLLEIHPKLRPVETAVDGVFLAGTCQGPKDIVDTLAQARAAASSALAPLCRGQVKIESATSSVNEEVCAGCGICVDIARDVMRLKQEGQSSLKVRQYIDAQYGSFGPSTNTALPTD